MALAFGWFALPVRPERPTSLEDDLRAVSQAFQEIPRLIELATSGDWHVGVTPRYSQPSRDCFGLGAATLPAQRLLQGCERPAVLPIDSQVIANRGFSLGDLA